jgi:hypothetical protein
MADSHADQLRQVIAELSRRLEEPTETLPSTRCIARPALADLIRESQSVLDLPKSRLLSATAILEQLQDARVIRAVALQDPAHTVGRDRLFAVGLGVDPEGLHPFELLQAHAPDGVICYMSAVAAHELTSQPVTQHHIARPETAPTRVAVVDESVLTTTVRSSTPSETRPHPAGRPAFVFQGIPYFVTRRDPRYLQSFQRRALNQSSQYRVTSLEQTLLDTLHRPMRCGGPAVVFEVWDNAAEQLRPERMRDLILRIGDPLLARRAGYQLEQQRGDIDPAVHALASVDRAPVSLLHGIPYTNLNARWQVLVP